MPSTSQLRAEIEERLAERIPRALSPAPLARAARLATAAKGIEIPQAGLTEICGLPGESTGRTAFMFSLMAQLTERGHCCAWVDASDSFDPASAQAAGVELGKVLWVRCGEKFSRKAGPRHPLQNDRARNDRTGNEKTRNDRRESTAKTLRPLEQAFKAADLLLNAGGFALLTVDLGSVEESALRKVPLTTWFRFARAVEKRPAALVFLTPAPQARSCAALAFGMRRRAAEWRRTAGAGADLAHGNLLGKFEIETEIFRELHAVNRKTAQSVRFNFPAEANWA